MNPSSLRQLVPGACSALPRAVYEEYLHELLLLIEESNEG
jgi:hypothetical protein